MTDYPRSSVAAMVCFAVFLSCGCSGKPSRVHAPSIDAVAAGQAAMEQYDTNQDGKVADEELQAAPSLKAAIRNLDKNGDSAVSAEEITARIHSWQDSKIGLMPGMCTITFLGKPLVGATVVLEPEPFLGENIKACKGTTNHQGRANLKIPDLERNLPGGSPGLYKIRITSPNIQLPAQYNSQTVLGAEIANDSPIAVNGLELHLK